MSTKVKTQKSILQKMNIEELNAMQEEAQKSINANENVVVLSPTGTGKTLAFLLPVIGQLQHDLIGVQALILVPSRELAIQIEQVIREMGSGFKTNAVYGGRAGAKDKIELQHAPAILIGTPGRIADHMRRERFSTENTKTLVLDEFDKSLEIGFEEEMSEIISLLPHINKRILTSATQGVQIPRFAGVRNPVYVNYLDQPISKMKINRIISSFKNKKEALVEVLQHLESQPGIVFCNFKDTIYEVSDFLHNHDIEHGCFFGGMEQKDRERALIKFRNGTHKLLIATDLAARGIDIPELKYILHYQLPHREEEFTHRNGRTARMNEEGTAYLLQGVDETLPDFLGDIPIYEMQESASVQQQKWETLLISGGRKDKISKGDIAGLFFKQGNLTKGELGVIEVKQDCAFVGVVASKAHEICNQLNNSRLKKKKVRITVI